MADEPQMHGQRPQDRRKLKPLTLGRPEPMDIGDAPEPLPGSPQPEPDKDTPE